MRGRRTVALIGIILLIGACGDSDDDNADAASSTTSATAPPVTAQIGGINTVIRGTSVAADGLEIEIDDSYFRPNILTGTSRQAVTLELASEANATHNFSLTEQGVDKDIPPAGKTTVKVVLPASGELVFFCKYHKDESGMVGALRTSP